ncbi:hypothetical protein [Prosthecomicrobium sp. N25]|uniref:hypothetical protein n=1 Tax=Prosthecomicrobium sp. N25 TaxID=3129254 RepID=UPI003077715E
MITSKPSFTWTRANTVALGLGYLGSFAGLLNYGSTVAFAAFAAAFPAIVIARYWQALTLTAAIVGTIWYLGGRPA